MRERLDIADFCLLDNLCVSKKIPVKTLRTLKNLPHENLKHISELERNFFAKMNIFFETSTEKSCPSGRKNKKSFNGSNNWIQLSPH